MLLQSELFCNKLNYNSISLQIIFEYCKFKIHYKLLIIINKSIFFQAPTGKLYGGNGYIALLAREEDKFSKSIAELFHKNWVNNNTEILEINFVLLNANSGMVVLTTVIMENVAPLGMRARIKVCEICTFLITYIQLLLYQQINVDQSDFESLTLS